MISSLGMESVVQLHRNSPSSSVVITNPTTANITAATPLNTNTSCSASSSFNMQQHNKNNSTLSPPTGANKRKQPHRAFHNDLQQDHMDNDCSSSPENMADDHHQQQQQARVASNKSPTSILRSSTNTTSTTAAVLPVSTNNGGFDQRNAFHLSTLSPFLAALQQQQALQQQLFSASAATFANATDNRDSEVGREGSTASSSRVSERLEEDEDSETCLGTGVEPEDLSLCKERKLEVDESGCATAASNWSYEEQFKQLYELSDDPKRKEWLDDWLSFMHRIGKPVTRIPIMAKQVLDLYELYRLVVQHGGLVEIINKKLWREITKGLNLPNSITSAAFTLRTQYQKYLYDYECHHENLSCLSDLQAAIEGNRRDGRRNHHSSSTPNPPSSMANNNGTTPSILHSHHSATAIDSTPSGPAASGFPYPLMGPHSMAAALFGKHLNAFNLKDEVMDLNAINQHISAQHSQHAFATAAGLDVAQQRQFELFQKAAIDAVAGSGRKINLPNNNSGRNSTSSFDSDNFAPTAKKPRIELPNTASSQPILDMSAAAHLDHIDHLFKDSSSAHMKLTNTRAQNGEKSMVVSMEINGVMYQGVLFAINSSSSATTSPPSLNTHSMHNGLLGMEQTKLTENSIHNNNVGSAETEYLERES